MKIGVNASALSSPYSGVSRYITNLYAKLIELDKQNEYIFFSYGEIMDRFVPQEILSRVKIYSFPVFFPKKLQKIIFDLFVIRSMLVEHKIDVFHSPSFSVPLGNKGLMKYVVTFHDLIPFQDAQFSSKLLSIYLKIVIKISMRLADVVIASSNNTAEDLACVFPHHPRAITIYLGIPDKYFVEGKSSKSDLLCCNKYILSVSTHQTRKNTDGIINAICTNDYLKNNYSLVVVGLIPKVQRERIQRLATQYGYFDRIIILEGISDERLIEIYQNAALLLYPSFYEGFGFPILEAMALKCPVITSNYSSMPELMPDKNWLVDPSNYDEIADRTMALLKLDRHKRNLIIESNMVWAKQFTWKNSAEKILGVFQGILPK